MAHLKNRLLDVRWVLLRVFMEKVSRGSLDLDVPREQSFTPTSTLQVLSVPFQIDLACLRVEQVPRARQGHLVSCGKSSLPLGWNLRLRPTTIVHYLCGTAPMKHI